MGFSFRSIEKHVFQIDNENDFEALALQVFRFQAKHCAVYRQFLKQLGVDPKSIEQTKDIPFLPIELFKTHKVVTGPDSTELIFSSSGTTGANTSNHFVASPEVYKTSFSKGFHTHYPYQKMHLLALLPSYLERNNSSLIYMVQHLMDASGSTYSGFYLDQYDELTRTLTELDTDPTPTLLMGVSFALLDLIEKYGPFNLQNTIIMETGGMKGRRKEMIREELHEHLTRGFGVKAIHSEYGMTELLSQAYSKGNGVFNPPNWMKILVRSTSDPFELLTPGGTGGINVIDLANLYSCSFLATQDLGKCHLDGQFEVLGRFDHSDVRGCNLLVQ